MSALWPTLEPQTFNAFAVNTAYGAAIGAYLANKTDFATTTHGALAGGLTYLLIAGSVVRLQVDQNPLSPSILLKPSLGGNVGSVIDGSIRDALNQPGPALTINRIPTKSLGDPIYNPKHQLARRD